MRVLILTTKQPEALRKHDCRRFLSKHVCNTINNILNKNIITIFETGQLNPFKRQLTDDSYMYVMPCIAKSQVKNLELKMRQDIVGAMVRDVLDDFGSQNQSNKLEILLVAHDEDLFKLDFASERSFAQDDLVVGSILDIVKRERSDALFKIYGYQHDMEDNERVYSIIYIYLIEKNELNPNTDIIQLIWNKIETNEKP